VCSSLNQTETLPKRESCFIPPSATSSSPHNSQRHIPLRLVGHDAMVGNCIRAGAGIWPENSLAIRPAAPAHSPARCLHKSGPVARVPGNSHGQGFTPGREQPPHHRRAKRIEEKRQARPCGSRKSTASLQMIFVGACARPDARQTARFFLAIRASVGLSSTPPPGEKATLRPAARLVPFPRQHR